jgi:hypothetical protein
MKGGTAGSRQRESARGRTISAAQPVGSRLGGMSGTAGRLSRCRTLRCTPNSYRTALASLPTVSRGSAARGASLTRAPPRAPALGGAGGERRGRRSLTVDPEGWALWVTGRCLSLMQSLWGYARGGSLALKPLATPPLGALRCCPRPAPAGCGHCRRRSGELRRGKRMGFVVDLAKAGEVASSADPRGPTALAAKPCQ